MLVATFRVTSALSLCCKMMKLRHILGALDGLKHWVDAHLSWFFTNGNKVTKYLSKFQWLVLIALKSKNKL